MQEKEIDGKAIWSYGNPEAEKVLIQLVGEHEISGIEQEFHAIQDRTSEEFYMIAWRVNNWNDELSPWKAPPAFGEEGFGDGASELLEKILEYCSDKSKTYYLGGYSLAGLFALWAAYESDVFSGIVCCSGSLWFLDWDHYVRNHVIQSKCSVYLSLGGKEEKAKNKVMAAVGDRTRAQERLLQEDSMVESVVLEWNAGGHFADAGKRLAKGVKWMFGVKSGL